METKVNEIFNKSIKVLLLFYFLSKLESLFYQKSLRGKTENVNIGLSTDEVFKK